MDIATMVSAPSMDFADLFSGPLTALSHAAPLSWPSDHDGVTGVMPKSHARSSRFVQERGEHDAAARRPPCRQDTAHASRVAEATYTGGHNIGLRHVGPPDMRRATSSR